MTPAQLTAYTAICQADPECFIIIQMEEDNA